MTLSGCLPIAITTGWGFRRLQAAGCGPLRAAGSQEGRNQGFSPLANHPFSFGREQTHRYLPKDLRHLLPQIRARFARKVRNAKLPAAHVPKATRRAGTTPQGRALPLGWQPILCLSQQKPGGNWKASLTLARAARPEGKRVIDKRGKTFGCPPLARSAAAQAAFPPAKSGHTRLPCWAHHKIQPFSA